MEPMVNHPPPLPRSSLSLRDSVLTSFRMASATKEISASTSMKSLRREAGHIQGVEAEVVVRLEQ